MQHHHAAFYLRERYYTLRCTSTLASGQGMAQEMRLLYEQTKTKGLRHICGGAGDYTKRRAVLSLSSSELYDAKSLLLLIRSLMMCGDDLAL